MGSIDTQNGNVHRYGVRYQGDCHPPASSDATRGRGDAAVAGMDVAALSVKKIHLFPYSTTRHCVEHRERWGGGAQVSQ